MIYRGIHIGRIYRSILKDDGIYPKHIYTLCVAEKEIRKIKTIEIWNRQDNRVSGYHINEIEKNYELLDGDL